jgi:hypothetical protein
MIAFRERGESMGARPRLSLADRRRGEVEPSEPADVASRFLEAFSAADFERMRALLAEDNPSRWTPTGFW